MSADYRGVRGLAISLSVLAAMGCSAGDGASTPPGGGGNGVGATGAGASGSGAAGGASGDGGSSSAGAGGTVLFGTGGANGGASGGGGASGASGAGASAGAWTCGQPVIPPDKQATEVCGNGFDDDLNGFVDENCTCTPSATQDCFLGSAWQAGQPDCHKGTQKCGGTQEFSGWGPCEGSGCGVVIPPEVCDNALDDNCDGRTDEGCAFDMTVNINDDCIGIPCPPQAPNPIGCDITMSGNDDRGCVAHAAGNPAVYFQEGNACPPFPGCGAVCGAGNVMGVLKCSVSPNPVTLDATNCAINKKVPTYTDNPGGCPK